MGLLIMLVLLPTTKEIQENVGIVRRKLIMEDGYITVKFVSGSDRLLSEITMSGNQNLHNTRQQIFNAGWIDHKDTLYLLPSGYIYKCQHDNFVLINPEFETEIPEFYLT